MVAKIYYNEVVIKAGRPRMKLYFSKELFEKYKQSGIVLRNKNFKEKTFTPTKNGGFYIWIDLDENAKELIKLDFNLK